MRLIEKEELLFLIGCSRKTEDEFIASRLDISVERAQDLKKTFFENHKVDYLKIRMPYVLELLAYLKNNEITMALASSSPMDNIEDVLKQCEIETYFKYIVSGENFKRTKPDPEIYEYTCKQIGVSKDEIWVVEDSEYGIEAAKKTKTDYGGRYMVGILITGHGHFASGIASSVELIMQSLEGVEVVDFPQGDTATELKENMHNALSKFDGEIVVFADLLSGSPFNTAVMEALENEKIQVVYGTNLGMLIECIMMRNMGSSAIEIANKACEVGQTQIGKFEKQLESDDDSSDEEW